MGRAPAGGWVCSPPCVVWIPGVMESVLTTSVTTEGESESVSSLVSRSPPLDRPFPDLNGHRHHLALLLRCRFWLRRSGGWGLRVCAFNTLPSAAVPAAGIWGTSVITTALFRIPREFRIRGTPSPNSLEDTCSLGKTANSIMCWVALILGFSLLGCFNFLGA